MKVACNIKDFTAISSALERLTAKSIRPKIIVLNREAARIGYFFRGCPVFDGTVFEKARVELQYSDWENDIVLFVGDPERMKVFSEEFPGGLQADEVFLDSGTGFRIYRRINQAFSSHRRWSPERQPPVWHRMNAGRTSRIRFRQMRSAAPNSGNCRSAAWNCRLHRFRFRRN